jgi:hypothetical protein
VNRWLTAMVRLFRPQIEWLIRQRDDVVADWQPGIRIIGVFEDRNLTSEIVVTIDEQLDYVRKAVALR